MGVQFGVGGGKYEIPPIKDCIRSDGNFAVREMIELICSSSAALTVVAQVGGRSAELIVINTMKWVKSNVRSTKLFEF